MAVRPLRPATDHRLGRPLPHQQANQTQAIPKAPGPLRSPAFLLRVSCGISLSFPRLSPTSGYIPTRYSPVRHSPAPNPKVRPAAVRLACVRHAASVQSEPGSNSSVDSLAFLLLRVFKPSLFIKTLRSLIQSTHTVYLFTLLISSPRRCRRYSTHPHLIVNTFFHKFRR